MDYSVFIPARYASTRFPGKPLAMLGGKPVIQWVYEAARSVVKDVWVATDDRRIGDAVEAFGGQAVMTRADHKSGTDRIEEAVELTGCQSDIIVNVQGDEPFIRPAQIETLCSLFGDSRTQIATLGIPFTGGSTGDNQSDARSIMDAVENPNSPKIVTDINGFALYFSRSVIPYVRGSERPDWPLRFPFLKHLGIYAYRREVLSEITRLPQSPLEKAESLEQLRWLQNGYRIKVGVTHFETVGIDTPADLDRAERMLR